MIKNFLKTAVRNILKYKGYTVINISGLAIGIACSILILLYVRNELSYDEFFDKSDRIFRLVDSGTIRGNPLSVAQTPSIWAGSLQNDMPEVEKIVRLKPPDSQWLIKYENRVFYEKGFVYADSSVFDVFNYEFVKGDPETALIGPNKVVITEETAVKYFGDDDPVGKILNGDNTYDFMVTGVIKNVPQNTHFHFDFLASYATLETNPNMYGGLLTNWMNHRIYTYILLHKEATQEQFESKLNGFVEKYLSQILQNSGIELNPYLQPLTSIHLHSHLETEMEPGGDMGYIYIFSIIAFFVLMIACINFMNLATARSANRAKEVGLRKVVGALRKQLLWQFLTESVFLTFLALVIALILVQIILPSFNNITAKSLGLADYFSTGNFVSIIGLTLFVGLVSGSYPAVILSGLQPVQTLKGIYKSGSKSSVLRKVLVIVQFTISIILIIGSLIVNGQLDFMRTKDLGFEKNNVIHIPMSDPILRTSYHPYKNRLNQNSFIENVTASSNGPGYGPFGLNVARVEGSAPDEGMDCRVMTVDFEFFETLNIEFLKGRAFSREFSTDSTACIINETAARKFGIEDVNTKGFLRGNNTVVPVIGIVKDFHIQSLHNTIEPLQFFLVNEQSFSHIFIKYKPENAQTVMEHLSRTWGDTYPNYPYVNSFVDEDFENLHRIVLNMQVLVGYFTAIAIFISCLGLFGLASFMAEQRKKEVGIRKVLGASSPNIVMHLSKEFVLFTVLANIIAWPVGYYMMNKWLENFAYKINIGVQVFLISAVVAFAVALLTVSYQAIRAALANPVKSLRYE